MCRGHQIVRGEAHTPHTPQPRRSLSTLSSPSLPATQQHLLLQDLRHARKVERAERNGGERGERGGGQRRAGHACAGGSQVVVSSVVGCERESERSSREEAPDVAEVVDARVGPQSDEEV